MSTINYDGTRRIWSAPSWVDQFHPPDVRAAAEAARTRVRRDERRIVSRLRAVFARRPLPLDVRDRVDLMPEYRSARQEALQYQILRQVR